MDAGQLKALACANGPDSEIPLDNLIEATQRRDADLLDSRLSILFGALGPIRFLRQVAVPLMHRIGDLWERGSLTVTGEHLVTSSIRTLLGWGLRLMPSARKDSPVALFLTPEGELHECGALAAAVLAKAAAIQAHYLGAQLPVDHIFQDCGSFDARLVGVSSSSLPPDRLREWCLETVSKLPGDVELWLGGCAAGELSDCDLPGVTVVGSEAEFEDALERFKVRQARQRNVRD